MFPLEPFHLGQPAGYKVGTECEKIYCLPNKSHGFKAVKWKWLWFWVLSSRYLLLGFYYWTVDFYLNNLAMIMKLLNVLFG